MSLRVKVRMSKIVRTPIKVRTPVADPCNAKLNAIIKISISNREISNSGWLYPLSLTCSENS